MDLFLEMNITWNMILWRKKKKLQKTLKILKISFCNLTNMVFHMGLIQNILLFSHFKFCLNFISLWIGRADNSFHITEFSLVRSFWRQKWQSEKRKKSKIKVHKVINI